MNGTRAGCTGTVASRSRNSVAPSEIWGTRLRRRRGTWERCAARWHGTSVFRTSRYAAADFRFTRADLSPPPISFVLVEKQRREEPVERERKICISRFTATLVNCTRGTLHYTHMRKCGKLSRPISKANRIFICILSLLNGFFLMNMRGYATFEFSYCWDSIMQVRKEGTIFFFFSIKEWIKKGVWVDRFVLLSIFFLPYHLIPIDLPMCFLVFITNGEMGRVPFASHFY